MTFIAPLHVDCSAATQDSWAENHGAAILSTHYSRKGKADKLLELWLMFEMW